MVNKNNMFSSVCSFKACSDLVFVNNFNSFRWNMTTDNLLLTEVKFIEPCLHKVGSKEAGQHWTEVAEHLNSRDGFRENPRDQRSAREKYKKLLNEFKAKTSSEEASSGIAVDPLTENEILLEEIGPLHDPVTWHGINYTGTQITQWDFQNKGKSGWTGTSFFVLEVPLRNLRPSVIYSAPCDRIVQMAYLTRCY